MTRMPLTSEALGELRSNMAFGLGDHRMVDIKAAVPGLPLGHESFDHRRHSPIDIDPLAPFSDALGGDHVRLVLPSKPVAINVVTEYSLAKEHPVLAQTKRNLASSISNTVEDALPGMLDYSYLYAVGNDIPVGLPNDVEAIPTIDDEQTSDAIRQLAHNGLTFVISSFRTLRLNDVANGDGMVGIKVNHALERFVPRNRGVLVVGGLAEIKTHKRKELDAFNARLEARHQGIVRTLEDSGVEVASIVTRTDQEEKYDEAEADKSIAAALQRVAGKH